MASATRSCTRSMRWATGSRSRRLIQATPWHALGSRSTTASIAFTKAWGHNETKYKDLAEQLSCATRRIAESSGKRCDLSGRRRVCPILPRWYDLLHQQLLLAFLHGGYLLVGDCV